jgi:hypothetical protein
MPIVSVRQKNRKLVAAGLLGLVGTIVGCGGGSSGESNVAPETPPPGASGQDVANAYKQAYGPTGTPKVAKGAPRFKAP